MIKYDPMLNHDITCIGAWQGWGSYMLHACTFDESPTEVGGRAVDDGLDKCLGPLLVGLIHLH